MDAATIFYSCSKHTGTLL